MLLRRAAFRAGGRAPQRRGCVTGMPSREELLRLSTKDLKKLALKRQLQTSDCTEKAHIVDKILGEPAAKLETKTTTQTPFQTAAKMFSWREILVIAALLGYASYRMYTSSESSEVRDLRKLAAAGDSSACIALAKKLYAGEGTAAKPAEAFEIIRRAADAGDAWAQTEVGGMYCRGEGTVQNYPTGYKYFLLAAQQNNQNAMYNLAKLCE
eukprot:gene20737-31951_t